MPEISFKRKQLTIMELRRQVSKSFKRQNESIPTTCMLLNWKEKRKSITICITKFILEEGMVVYTNIKMGDRRTIEMIFVTLFYDYSHLPSVLEAKLAPYRGSCANDLAFKRSFYYMKQRRYQYKRIKPLPLTMVQKM